MQVMQHIQINILSTQRVRRLCNETVREMNSSHRSNHGGLRLKQKVI